MIYLTETYTSNNPCGIDINLGYYALMECIIKGTNTNRALQRWCGLANDETKAYKKRRFYPPRPEITQMILEIYQRDTSIKNTEIAKMLKCSKSLVTRALKTIGVKRTRWDGHTSIRKKKGAVT